MTAVPSTEDYAIRTIADAFALAQQRADVVVAAGKLILNIRESFRLANETNWLIHLVLNDRYMTTSVQTGTGADLRLGNGYIYATDVASATTMVTAAIAGATTEAERVAEATASIRAHMRMFTQCMTADHVLVRYTDNYSDEFNITGWKLMTGAELQTFVAEAEKITEPIEWYFGTNEAIEFANMQVYLSRFTPEAISASDAETLQRLFNGSSGEWPKIDDDDDDDE